MQENPIALSPHVQRLIDEKYSVVIDGDYLIVVDVPYISEPGVISRGSIISSYQYINGTEILGDHTVWFTGSVPFSASGKPLNDVLVANATKATVANREVQCHFSYKSDNKDTLENIYNKVMHYIRKLHSYTSVLNPCVNASGEGKVSVKQKKSVFHYPNTSISKSGLDAYDAVEKCERICRFCGCGCSGVPAGTFYILLRQRIILRRGNDVFKHGRKAANC